MAARVVDGLFVGDALSSMDVNFLVANKITRVINCAALELENRWEALGIEYLSFEWVAEENFDLLAADGMTQAWGQDANEFEVEGCPCVWLGKTCAFIEEALEVGAGVLVHSQDGTNRACSCVLAYLMNVYGWSLHKSMSFLQRKRSDLLPSQKFVKQLQQVSDWLETTYLDAMPHAADWAARKFRSWNVADIDLHMISTRANEELLLHNTYLNSDASESQPHAVWAKAGHDAGNLHPNESSRTTEMPLLFDQQKTLAPVTDSSPHRAKRKSRREAGLACREPKFASESEQSGYVVSEPGKNGSVSRRRRKWVCARASATFSARVTAASSHKKSFEACTTALYIPHEAHICICEPYSRNDTGSVKIHGQKQATVFFNKDC
ncbi:Dual specificity protein phosphatase [Hondaea fermentalgiana]|uniref:Dual specificity protein phosphatase n=1 Tax=Hondaea fermentalgiana TaxID=2315210 RepID=A0A2R5GIE9_9STRA|nr:Dual specificity protein phosphatase [Hondaea fermentalgiana]|eukprot:GBG30667.1 Dual specificity protein phosphatase [Hondaea fermentalgiana]